MQCAAEYISTAITHAQQSNRNIESLAMFTLCTRAGLEALSQQRHRKRPNGHTLL